jgi:glycosyltransferase involved in cell wall biosynthesis
MKILFLTPWYPDEQFVNHGIFVREQAVAVQAVHEVWVISSKVDYTRFGFLSSSIKEGEYKGVREFRLKIKKSFLIFNQFNFLLLTLWHTWRISRNFQPDIIHANISYPGAFWGWCMSKILGKPFVVTEHTRIQNNFRTRIHKLLTVSFLRRASTVITVSKWQAGEIFSLLGITTFVVPNIISFERFEGLKAAPVSKPVQVGFLGSLNTSVKGLDLLLNAVSSIREDFKLHIGGDGILLEQYKSLAKELDVYEKCVFYGFVPPEQVSTFMERLHFFVSASRSETFGIVMIEAMAVGLPVVATNSGGPQDFITIENGILVPKENVGELQLAIEKMLDQHHLYNKSSIKTFARNHFSADIFLASINKIYDFIRK